MTNKLYVANHDGSLRCISEDWTTEPDFMTGDGADMRCFSEALEGPAASFPPWKREAVIRTVMESQALSGVELDRENVERSVDRALSKPPIDL